MTAHCPHCRRTVVPVKHSGVSVARVLVVGPLALAAKKTKQLSCPACGTPLTASKAPGGFGTYRCTKNGHKLSSKRAVCPIDGSPVHRI